MDNIIIIQSDRPASLMIAKYLESAGYRIFICGEGEQALDLVKTIRPSLIICSTELRGMSGYEILSNLIEEESTASIPFIFLASGGDAENMQKGLALGADSYIIKPIKVKELLNVIRIKLNKLKLIKKQGLVEYIRNHIDDEHIKTNNSILLNVNKKIKLINKNDIEYITALGPYTKLYVIDKGIIQVRKLLKVWECILPEENFIKIHRSAIINCNFIREIERNSSRALRISMENSNKAFITSQRLSSRVKSRFQMK